MKKILFVLLSLLIIVSSCSESEFIYPESKVWAHRANDIETAKAKSQEFDGLEVDVTYSESSKTFFVGHNAEDTAKGITLNDWLAAIPSPENKCYWIDLKNLNKNNAEDISREINDIENKFKIQDKTFVESPNYIALRTLKKKGIRVILWTNSLANIDTATWCNQMKEQIDYLGPDAISNSAEMSELIINTFPEQNIHLWQTPAKYNDTNAEQTRKLCSNNNVKVVLVDYDKPIKE